MMPPKVIMGFSSSARQHPNGRQDIELISSVQSNFASSHSSPLLLDLRLDKPSGPYRPYLPRQQLRQQRIPNRRERLGFRPKVGDYLQEVGRGSESDSQVGMIWHGRVIPSITSGRTAGYHRRRRIDHSSRPHRVERRRSRTCDTPDRGHLSRMSAVTARKRRSTSMVGPGIGHDRRLGPGISHRG